MLQRVVLAGLCVWPVCVGIPLALFCRQWVGGCTTDHVLSGSVLVSVAAGTSFGTSVCCYRRFMS